MKLALKRFRNTLDERRASYPPIGDQLDAVMKMGAALREAGFALPAETVKWIEECHRVKRDIPKES